MLLNDHLSHKVELLQSEETPRTMNDQDLIQVNIELIQIKKTYWVIILQEYLGQSITADYQPVHLRTLAFGFHPLEFVQFQNPYFFL